MTARSLNQTFWRGKRPVNKLFAENSLWAELRSLLGQAPCCFPPGVQALIRRYHGEFDCQGTIALSGDEKLLAAFLQALDPANISIDSVIGVVVVSGRCWQLTVVTMGAAPECTTEVPAPFGPGFLAHLVDARASGQPADAAKSVAAFYNDWWNVMPGNWTGHAISPVVLGIHCSADVDSKHTTADHKATAAAAAAVAETKRSTSSTAAGSLTGLVDSQLPQLALIDAVRGAGFAFVPVPSVSQSACESALAAVVQALLDDSQRVAGPAAKRPAESALQVDL